MRMIQYLLPMLVVLLPASARADAIEPCGTDRPPTVVLGSTDYGSALSDRAVIGRALTFYVVAGPLDVADRVQVTAVENGVQTLLSYRDGYDLDRPFHVTPKQAGELVLSAAYTEDGLSRDGYLPDCAQVVAKTVSIRQGQMLRPPNVKADDYDSGAIFRLHAAPASCTSDFDPSPVVVGVRRSSKDARWVRVAVADQCSGWRTEHSGGPLSLERVRYDDRQLIFSPAMPARRDAVRTFRYRISRGRMASDGAVVASETVRAGKVIVSQTYRPAYRIYAWKPDAVVNDDYWNVCVKEGRETWVQDGNAYCIEPGQTWARVRVT